jgi:hypothetical protein
MGEGGGEDPANPSKAAYPTKVIGAFLRKHVDNMDLDDMLRGSVMRKIEEGIVGIISSHYDDVSAEVLIHAGMSTRGYQKVVNLLSCVQENQRLVRARLPYGTCFPKLGSLRLIGGRVGGLMAGLGVKNASLKPP